MQYQWKASTVPVTTLKTSHWINIVGIRTAGERPENRHGTSLVALAHSVLLSQSTLSWQQISYSSLFVSLFILEAEKSRMEGIPSDDFLASLLLR